MGSAHTNDQACQLHCHSSYSFKDGLPLPDALVARAAELGQPGIGITEHGHLYSAPAFFAACKDAGIKGVIGMEAYEAVPHTWDPDPDGPHVQVFKEKYDPDKPRYYHLTLWVMNATGWETLCAIHSKSFTKAFKPKNQPLVDRATLEQHNEGLILGLGCPQSRTNQALQREGIAAALSAAQWYFEVFPGRVYVEVMSALPDQVRALDGQRRLAKHFGAHCLGTNDVHYLRQSDGVVNGAHHMLVMARKFKSADTIATESGDASDDAYGSWYGCLAHDTLILTSRGVVPIREVRAGDYVMGRRGWKSVKKAWSSGVRQVYRLTLQNGSQIVSTANHRFFTQEGEKPVDQLRRGDRLEVDNDLWMASIMAFTPAMTERTESNQIPGRTVLESMVRDDVMYGQTPPLRSADATHAVPLTNLRTQGVGPRKLGIVHVSRAFMWRNPPIGLSLTPGDPYSPISLVPQVWTDYRPHSLWMQAQQSSGGLDRSPGEVERESLSLCDWVGAATMGIQAPICHESAKSGCRVRQLQEASDGGVGVAQGMEVSNIFFAPNQASNSLGVLSQRPVTSMAFDIEVPSISALTYRATRAGHRTDRFAAATHTKRSVPDGAYGSSHPLLVVVSRAQTPREDSGLDTTRLSARHTGIINIQPCGHQATFDLNVEGGCFLANGIYTHNSDQFYLKTRQEMLQAGIFAPEIDAGLELLDRVNFDFLSMAQPQPPVAHIPQPGDDPQFDAYVAARA